MIPYGTLVTPSGTYEGVHLMRSGTVPFATVMMNGLPFSAANNKGGRSSVCPEDVMYLSYPMGPVQSTRVSVVE